MIIVRVESVHISELEQATQKVCDKVSREYKLDTDWYVDGQEVLIWGIHKGMFRDVREWFRDELKGHTKVRFIKEQEE